MRNLDLNENYGSKFYLDDPMGGSHMNILKAGLMTAQRLVAVSVGYAWECKTPVRWPHHCVLLNERGCGDD